MRYFAQLILVIVSLNYPLAQQDAADIGFYNEKNEWVLKELLNEIQLHSDIELVYSSTQLNLDQKVLLAPGHITLAYCFETIERSASIKIVRYDNRFILVKNFLNTGKSQGSGSLSGFVKDERSGERLIGANIFIQPDMTGTTSDLNGYFYVEWTDKKTTKSITISYVGYEDQKFLLSAEAELQSDFFLKAGSWITPVIIYDKSSIDGSLQDMEWPAQDQPKLQFLPGSFGGLDIFRELSLLPGVSKSTDLQSGLSIRGLSSAQTNYLVDGIHLYEPNHSFGLFSVFNHNAVNHVELYKHNVPFEYSGKVSGVVNHQLKDGDLFSWKANAGINPVAMDLTLEGPLLTGKTSLMLSGRKSLIDAYLPFMVENTPDYSAPSIDFWDINFKVSHSINPRHKIEIMSLQYQDNVAFTYNSQNRILRSRIHWNSDLGGIRWKGVFGNQLAVSSQLAWSNYNNHKNARISNLFPDQDTVSLSILGQSHVRDFILHSHIRYFFNQYIIAKAGTRMTWHRLRPSLYRKIPYEIEDLTPQLESGIDSLMLESELYFELDYAIKPWLIFGFGGQWSRLTYPVGFPVNHFNPVVNIEIKAFSDHLFVMSVQRSDQHQHLLQQNNYGLSSDFWLPATPLIPSERMWQFALDYHGKIQKNLLYNMSLYYRELDGLTAFKNQADSYDPVLDRGVLLPIFSESGNWESKVMTHEAVSAGLEQELKLRFKKITGILAYTLSGTDFVVKSADATDRYPADFDIRHSGHLYIKYAHRAEVNWFISWQFHTGRPFSMPLEGYLNKEGQWVLSYYERNNWRLNPYHGLDVGLFGAKEFGGARITYSFGITNLYDHDNPVSTKLFYEENVFDVRQLNGFPRLPFIRINLHFN